MIDNMWLTSALWIGLALISALISIRLALSVRGGGVFLLGYDKPDGRAGSAHGNSVPRQMHVWVGDWPMVQTGKPADIGVFDRATGKPIAAPDYAMVPGPAANARIRKRYARRKVEAGAA